MPHTIEDFTGFNEKDDNAGDGDPPYTRFEATPSNTTTKFKYCIIEGADKDDNFVRMFLSKALRLKLKFTPDPHVQTKVFGGVNHRVVNSLGFDYSVIKDINDAANDLKAAVTAGPGPGPGPVPPPTNPSHGDYSYKGKPAVHIGAICLQLPKYVEYGSKKQRR